MPELELGFPGYRAGTSGSSSTLTFTHGERVLGIWTWANGTDGFFLVLSAQGGSTGANDFGDTIRVRNASGREWNPQARLINPSIKFSSSLDWMVEFIKASP